MRCSLLMIFVLFGALASRADAQSATIIRGYYETASYSEIAMAIWDWTTFEYDTPNDNDGSATPSAYSASESSYASVAPATATYASGFGSIAHSIRFNTANQPTTRVCSSTRYSSCVSTLSGASYVEHLQDAHATMDCYAEHAVQISPSNLLTTVHGDIEVAWHLCHPCFDGTLMWELIESRTQWYVKTGALYAHVDVFDMGYYGSSYLYFDDASMHYVPHTDPLVGSVDLHLVGTVEDEDEILIYGDGTDYVELDTYDYAGPTHDKTKGLITHDVRAVVTTPPDGGSATSRSYGGT